MKNKTQVLIIHGGMTFRSKRGYLHYLKTRDISLDRRIGWADDYLSLKLGKTFQVIKPRMPFPDNAKYEEWKIHFERYIPLLGNKTILIGNSLGGIFLAKYLSEHRFPKKIISTYMLCAPFDDSLPGEELAGGFKLKANLSLIEKNSKKVTLMFSKDDDVVPVSHADKYRKKLKNAAIIIYKSKNGHFKIAKFPEIVKMIKEDAKGKATSKRQAT